jgi:hypothetical protein
MELLLGSHVREGDHRVGRLAGFELEPPDLKIRRIIFSPDGDLGPQAAMRPLAAIATVHEDGEIELHDVQIEPMRAVRDVALIARATRLRRAGREHGRLVGLGVDPSTGTVVSVFGRLPWWSRRFSVAANAADLTTPGEISLNGGDSRAA